MGAVTGLLPGDKGGIKMGLEMAGEPFKGLKPWCEGWSKGGGKEKKSLMADSGVIKKAFLWNCNF